jgi:light-regulated signal transduction histidine kinase (bacteriophytochrome)
MRDRTLRKYLTLFELLKKKYQETDDPKEKQRIQGLIDAEADSQAMQALIEELKTEAARRLVSRASLAYMVKHVLNLSAEFKTTK